MNERAYTLLEMMAVIAIVLIAGVAIVSGVSSVRKAGLSTAAARLAASVRYLYELSVLNNRSYRLVIDIEGGSFRGDVVVSPCKAGIMPSEEERKFDLSPFLQQSVQEISSERARGSDESEEGRMNRRPKENLLGRQVLPKGIRFAGVVTAHNEEPVESGEAEIFFFPDGYVEKALIYLQKGEETYTVETIPLKGIALVHTEEIDPYAVLWAK